MGRRKKDNRIYHALRRIMISTIFLFAVAISINLAPNYEKSDLDKKLNLIINNNNITKSLKSEIVIENNMIYLSFDDVQNFFDEYLLLDGNKIITTSNTKTVSIPINGGKMYVNGSYRNSDCNILIKNDKYLIRDNIKDKMGILDLELDINDNEKVDVEIQLVEKKDFIKRLIWYGVKIDFGHESVEVL